MDINMDVTTADTHRRHHGHGYDNKGYGYGHNHYGYGYNNYGYGYYNSIIPTQLLLLFEWKK